MIALLAASWGVLLKRLRADWLLLAATGLTIVLATTLLAAGPLYTESVTLAGLRRTLGAAPPPDANLALTASLLGRSYAATDRVVAARLAETLGPTGGAVWRSGRSESFALPGQPANDVRDLAVFAFFEGIEGRAALVAGAWPAGGAEPFAVAIPASVAEERGYRVGDELRLQSRLTATFQPRIRIVGLYRVADPADPYWFNDPLDTTGRELGQSFNTFGPLVVPQATLLGPLGQNAARFTWRAYPDIGRLTAGDLAPLRARIAALPSRLDGAAQGTTFQLDTRLPTQLATAERSLLVTRSGVLIQLIQLAVLAGYALVLTAGLIVEQRRGEAALLHARGVGPGQAALLAALEGLILAVPAALVAPWLALLSLRLLGAVGPLALLGPLPVPPVGRAAYGLAAGAALGCLALLALPALGAARALDRQHLGRGRQAARGIAQRAGLDLALVALALVAYWQLRRYGTPLTRTIQGRLGLDPLLAVAPGLGLLAGAVIALRLVPLLARAAEAVVAGGRATAALGAWQVARRPQRYARAALLLILALGIGLFAAAYARTWGESQGDQADYQVGADLRVEPDRRFGAPFQAYQLPGAYAALPGVRAAMPALRRREELSRAIGVSDLLLLDSARAAAIVPFRPDLADEPIADLLGRLAAGRPALATVALPGTPRRLALDLRATRPPRPANAAAPAPLAATLALQDATGMVYRLQLGNLRADGQPERLIAPLAAPVPGGAVAAPAYPLAVLGLEIATAAGRSEARAQLDLLGLRLSDADSGAGWATVPLDRDPARWAVAFGNLSAVVSAPSAEPLPAPADGTFAVRLNTGSISIQTPYPLSFSIRPAGGSAPDTLPILADARLLATLGVAVGDTLEVNLIGARRVRIVGALRGFPTLDPTATAPFVVADLPTIAALGFAPGREVPEPLEAWLATDPDGAAAVAVALRRAPFNSPLVLGRAERAAGLRADPLALGTIGALALGFAAAALVAILGFALSAAVAARERQAEFALLRALGLHPRQLIAWLSLEQGITVGLSLLGGILLGLVLARLVLPLVTLTQAGAAAYPPTRVAIPWATAALLVGVTLATLLAVAVAIGAIVRRVGLGGALRVAEE